MTEQAVPPARTEDETVAEEPADDPAPVTADAVDPVSAAPADAEPGNAAGGSAEDQAEDDEDDDEDERPGRPLLRVLAVLGVVAVLVGAATVAALRFDLVERLLVRDATADARVGDCLGALPDVEAGAERRSAEARTVACSSPDARYDIVGRVTGLSAAEARESRRCEPFVTAGGEYYTYSSVPPGGTGYLLCLVPRG